MNEMRRNRGSIVAMQIGQKIFNERCSIFNAQLQTTNYKLQTNLYLRLTFVFGSLQNARRRFT